MAIVEMNPGDAGALSVQPGDIVEIFNDYGSTYAMAYPDPSIKSRHTFMQFGWFNGRDQFARTTSFKSRRYPT